MKFSDFEPNVLDQKLTKQKTVLQDDIKKLENELKELKERKLSPIMSESSSIRNSRNGVPISVRGSFRNGDDSPSKAPGRKTTGTTNKVTRNLSFKMSTAIQGLVARNSQLV